MLIAYEYCYEYRHVLLGSDNLLAASSRAQLQDCCRQLKQVTLIVYEYSYKYRHALL